MKRPDFRLVHRLDVSGAVSSRRLAILGLVLAAPLARAELKFFQATTTPIILSSNPVNTGQPLTLTGRVQDARRIPVNAGRVQIQMAETPEGPWEMLGERQA